MKSDIVYLRHIIDAIAKVESYASVGKDAFMTSKSGVAGRLSFEQIRLMDTI